MNYLTLRQAPLRVWRRFEIEVWDAATHTTSWIFRTTSRWAGLSRYLNEAERSLRRTLPCYWSNVITRCITYEMFTGTVSLNLTFNTIWK